MTGTRNEGGEFTNAAVGVVALCFILNTLARGCGETFAVFYGSFLDEFDWSRAEVSSIYSVFMIGIGVGGPCIGLLFDRLGGRLVYVGGLVCYGVGFLIASQMQALWQGYLGLGILVGIGAAATGMTPATGLLARWFDRSIGFATGVAYAGLAAGAMLLAPLSRVMIDAHGWRWAYQVLGSGMLCLGAVILILPWKRIGAGAVVRLSPRPQPMAIKRQYLTQAPFWGMFMVFFTAAVATYVIQVQAVVYLEEAGYSPIMATFLFGLNSFFALVGIVGAGWLADRFGRRVIATATFTGSIIGILALAALKAGPNPWLVGLFMLGFGGAMGSRGPIVSSLSARLFPGQVGAVFGAVMIGMGVGGAFGSWIAGWLYEVTGGYSWGFGVAIAAMLIGMAQFWLIEELATGRWREERA
jgi:MFS family permease